MIPTSEQLLSSLPALINLWSVVTLGWGVYVLLMYNKAISHARTKKLDYTNSRCNTIFILFGNTALITFLMVEPLVINVADAIIVTNAVFGGYLVLASLALSRWWKMHSG